MNTLKLLFTFFRISVLNETAYRVNFFIQLFQSILELGSALAGLAVIFSYTTALGGWRPDEMLALVGVYFLIGGVISLVIQPGMSALINSVRDGTLDFTLTKPEDAQLLVSIQRVAVFSLIDLLMGLGVLIAALIRLREAIGGWQAAAFIGMLGAGCIIVYSFWLILASLAFWLVRVEESTRDLPEHVPGWSLADQSLSGLASLWPDVHRACGVRHHRPGRGADRPLERCDLVGGARAGGHIIRTGSPHLAVGIEALFGRLRLVFYRVCYN